MQKAKYFKKTITFLDDLKYRLSSFDEDTTPADLENHLSHQNPIDHLYACAIFVDSYGAILLKMYRNLLKAYKKMGYKSKMPQS